MPPGDMRLCAIPLLLCFLVAGSSCSAQGDRMTLKTFATATGRLEAIDLQNREIVWRLDSDLEMRFPFVEVRFILFGAERMARVRADGDTTLAEGLLSEFTPDGDLKLRQPGKKNLLRILPRYRSIEFRPAAEPPASPSGK